MKDKKGFMLYADQRGVFNKLSNEQAGDLIKHIFSYVNDENPKGDFVTELAFESIKQQLKRDLVKWNDRAERSRFNGQSGGRPRNPEKPRKTQKTQRVISKPRKPDNVNVNVNDNVNDNVNKEKGLPFKNFWDSYDKKIGSKQKCNQKWDKLTFEIQNDILNHLDNYIPSTPDKRYRVNPETYLNQRRWENEIINNQDGTKKQRGATDEQILTSIINAQE